LNVASRTVVTGSMYSTQDLESAYPTQSPGGGTLRRIRDTQSAARKSAPPGSLKHEGAGKVAGGLPRASWPPMRSEALFRDRPLAGAPKQDGRESCGHCTVSVKFWLTAPVEFVAVNVNG
jgi:hypothetical protein